MPPPQPNRESVASVESKWYCPTEQKQMSTFCIYNEYFSTGDFLAKYLSIFYEAFYFRG